MRMHKAFFTQSKSIRKSRQHLIPSCSVVLRGPSEHNGLFLRVNVLPEGTPIEVLPN